MNASYLQLELQQKLITQTMDNLPIRASKMICKMSNQSIMFCGVGEHHKNGIAECKIKELLVEQGRKWYPMKI
jgi:hypothetical protein